MPTTPAEPDNMMADLQSVVSKMRDEPAAEPDGETPEAPSGLTEAADEAPEADAAPTETRPRREDGTFAPKPKETKQEPKAKTPEVVVKPKLAAVPKPPDGALTETKPAEAAAPAAPATKAPTNWRPEVREKWATLPPDVQAEIVKREREISVGLGAAATSKQEAERYRQVSAPYEMMLRADGVDGPKKFAGLLQLEAGLRTGTPPQKAGIVANIVRQFGVTVEDLAAALDGKPAPGGTAPPPDYRDPRVDQLFATIQQRQQQQEAQQQAEAEAALAKIRDTNEFYEDLRDEAADILEMAAKRGRPISLEEAFDRAARLHPEVSKVLEQRKAAETAKAKALEAQKKRAAASSIRSLPGTPPGDEGETDGSLRGDLDLVAKRLAAR